MKEFSQLSIEQKAKAYDEAKLRMRIAFNSNRCTIGFMNEIFPELKESEDERIRKGIISGMVAIKEQGKETFAAIRINDCITWLKKQGEKKPTNKVEPKFKVKYAGNEYNVLEVKDIYGIEFYGIEDEPNHIDYVKAENCEIISGCAIKENGSSYPTKSTMFSTWSEEDEAMWAEISDLLYEGYKQSSGKFSWDDIRNWVKLKIFQTSNV